MEKKEVGGDGGCAWIGREIVSNLGKSAGEEVRNE